MWGLGRRPKTRPQMVAISLGRKGGVLGLEVDDELAHVRGQRRLGRAFRGVDIGEQADHAQLFEAPGAMVQGAARDTGLQGALGGRLAVEDNGAQDLVASLLGPLTPFVGVQPVLHRL